MTEKSEIKRMNAKAHKNSGRGNKKGDATWNDFVVDIKEASKSFTLNQKVWAKVTTDAIKSGTDKSPALIIVLGEGTQKVRLLIAELGVIEELVDRV
jgi:outer membrane phospholipase A